MRILIAEDDFAARRLLTIVLEKLGHEVMVACDGAEAWDVMQRPDAPRLAVLDRMMPGMDGLEVCRRVRAQDTNQPPYLIMLTALGDKEQVAAGFDAGADDYVVKPFGHTELRARIAAGQRVLGLQERLAAEAKTDELTGLINRRAGLDALRRELARSSREGLLVGVGLLDVDHFKRINDSHGHPVGDDVLRGLAGRLGATLRPYDHLCRLGGDELLVVAPGAAGRAPWERLRAVVAGSPFPTRAGELEVTVSVGHTTAGGESDPEKLIATADRALYRAKEAGRNRVEREDDVGPGSAAGQEEV